MNPFPPSSHALLFDDFQPFYSDANAPPETQPSSNPATPDADVDADAAILSTEPLLRYGIAQPPISDLPSLLDTSTPFPLPSALPLPLETPIREGEEPQLDLSLGLSAVITALPTPPLHRTPHNLRLPSFDVLGIAAPHPDHISLRSTSSFSLGAGPLSNPEDPLHVLSPLSSLDRRAKAFNGDSNSTTTSTNVHLEHLISTVTPPSESGTVNWGSFVNVRTAGLGSPPNSDPGLTPNLNLTASATSPEQATIVVRTYIELSHALGMAAWVEEVKNTISRH